MKPGNGDARSAPRRFRLRLFATMALVVFALTAAGLYFGDRSVMAAAAQSLQADFQAQVNAMLQVEQQRHAFLSELCRNLTAKPRLHAALEDNALDLLYPTANDELRGLTNETDTLRHMRFYRFLDGSGAVIPPTHDDRAGDLSAEAEKQLALPGLPTEEQFGCIATEGPAAEIDEVFATPIASTETGAVISALVAGFAINETPTAAGRGQMRAGIWVRDRFWSRSLNRTERNAVESQLREALKEPGRARHGNVNIATSGVQCLVFYRQLNAGSVFSPAYQVGVYPLTEFLSRRATLRRGTIGGGALLLALGLLATRFASARLVKPVEELAEQTQVERIQRQQAESALATTSSELQRSARFSADASHQLKSPVAVLRASIEALMARPEFAPEVYDELSSMLHQTYRLTGIVNDLLLLSRMDAGRLQIQFQPVEFSLLIEEWLEDLAAMPDALGTRIQTNVPRGLCIVGEKHYVALIVQNLLENARKYNRPGGTVYVGARSENGRVIFTVGNSGRPIPRDAHEHIFERFHRGAVAEDLPGHGLGLNLARELARLHGGDLRLVRSDDDWTEFAVSFVSSADKRQIA